MKKNYLPILIGIILLSSTAVAAYHLGTKHSNKAHQDSKIDNPVPDNHPAQNEVKGSVFNSTYQFGLDIPPGEKYIELPMGGPSNTYKQEIWFENATQSAPFAWIDMKIKVSSANPELSTLRPKDFYYYKSKPYQLGNIKAKLITVGRGEVLYYYIVAKIGKYYLQIDKDLIGDQKFDELLSTFRYFGNEMIVKLNPEESNATGTAIFTDLGNGKTKVVIELEDMAGKPPASIYRGSCATPGKVTYLLTPVSNDLKTNSAPGQSETILNVSLDSLRAMTPLAIGVRHLPLSSEQLLSSWCGDIN